MSPVGIEVVAPGAAATLTLRNGSSEPLNAQIRALRWTQVNGEEKLVPTDDVVASPPIVTLAANTDYTVRVVRVTKQPVNAAESYRLLVDELPGAKGQQGRAVNFVMRYSIPVFFYERSAAAPQLDWSIVRIGAHLYVTASNGGDRPVRLAALTLHDAHGATASFGTGLTGYVLGHSTMRWAAPPSAGRLNLSSSIAISAQGSNGSINASTSVQSLR